MKKIRIWIADDHVVVRSGLRQIVAATPDLAISGESQDGPGTMEAVQQKKFDVLLLDLSMPGGGVELIPRLLQARPALRMVVLTMHSEPQMAAHAVRAGAAGYVTKDASVTLLLDAIRTVAAGRNFMEPGLADALLFQRVSEEEPSPEVLTRREYEILKHLASGQSLVNIASRLGCSAKTVSVHKSRLMRKLNIGTNVDLFHYASRHGLIMR
ncbi:MAG: response regulator transcription factor [Rhodocyclaceae bacterium]|jgi:DNA-binding NarL/FixJ family response regulator|nr:response regulator transcription factor [Rhodocyclaceae bacterium]